MRGNGGIHIRGVLCVAFSAVQTSNLREVNLEALSAPIYSVGRRMLLLPRLLLPLLLLLSRL